MKSERTAKSEVLESDGTGVYSTCPALVSVPKYTSVDVRDVFDEQATAMPPLSHRMMPWMRKSLPDWKLFSLRSW